jgi:hypothetical protein
VKSSFVERVYQAYDDLRQKRGDFSVFALIELQKYPNRWDVIVQADWLPAKEWDSMDVIFDVIEPKLTTQEERLMLASVVVLDKSDPFYCELKVLVKNNKELTHNVTIAGLDVKQIYILQFQLDEITQSVRPAIYNEIAKLDNLKILQDIKNLVDSKIHAKETANVHQLSH